MNRLLTWIGLVDEGEPRPGVGYRGRGDETGRRPPPRSAVHIVGEDPPPPMSRSARIAEPVPPYQRPAVIPAVGDADVIVRAPEPTMTSAGYTETIEAHDFDDVRRVADLLREQIPVVISLKKVDPGTVQRMVDFLCGLVYALEGTIQKPAPGVLLIRPPRVTIARQELRRLAALGLYDVGA